MSESGCVIVVGATGGIGSSCVDLLVERGIPVALVGRGGDVLAAEVDRRRRAGQSVTGHAYDLARSGSAEPMVAACVGAHGGLRGVVNTAAVYEATPVVGMDVAAAARIIDVNLLSALAITAAAAMHLAAAGSGRIVHVTSVTAFVSRGDYTAYEASKAGLVAAARSAAVELAGRGVAVNTVAPGWVRTPMSEEFLDGTSPAEVGALIPCGRVCDPSEIAEVVRWLVLDAPPVLTGQTLVVDGGQSIRTGHL